MKNDYYYVLGFCLDLDNTILIILVLRSSITKLREMGLGDYAPLDDHIYLHKICGYFVFFHATIHTAMHLLNFGKFNTIICNVDSPYIIILRYRYMYRLILKILFQELMFSRILFISYTLTI